MDVWGVVWHCDPGLSCGESTPTLTLSDVCLHAPDEWRERAMWIPNYYEKCYPYCGQLRYSKLLSCEKYADQIHGRLITELNMKTFHFFKGMIKIQNSMDSESSPGTGWQFSLPSAMVDIFISSSPNYQRSLFCIRLLDPTHSSFFHDNTTPILFEYLPLMFLRIWVMISSRASSHPISVCDWFVVRRGYKTLL